MIGIPLGDLLPVVTNVSDLSQVCTYNVYSGKNAVALIGTVDITGEILRRWSRVKPPHEPEGE